MNRLCFVFLFALTLVSCVSLKSVELKNPDNIVCDIDEYQLISGKLPYTEGESAFEAWTVASKGFIEITLFLPTGQTFCRALWNGKDFDYQSSFLENGSIFAKTLINNFIDCYSSEKNDKILTLEGNGYSYTVETL